VKIVYRPQRSCTAALPCVMIQGNNWEINNLPIILPHSFAQVGIFPVHKKPFVHQAYLFNRLSPHDHTGTRHPVHFLRCFTIAFDCNDVGTRNRIVGKVTCQWGRPAVQGGQSIWKSPGGTLSFTIGIENLRPGDSYIRVTVHVVDNRLQKPRYDIGIRIYQYGIG